MDDKKKNRYFILQHGGFDTEHIFKSKYPHLAARKAAVRSYTTIELRERGTLKIHCFTGKTVEKPKHPGAPENVPDTIKRGVVRKIGIKKLRR